MFKRSIVSLSQLILSGVSTAPHSQELLRKVLDPATPVPEVATIANEIAPLLSSTQVTIRDKYHLLHNLAARKIRHEGVLQKCVWDILKADPTSLALPPASEDTQLLREDERSPAAVTASTFRLFCELEFAQDYQLVALALGRCVEVAPWLSLRSAADVYVGLAALNVQHFSLTSVALHESNVKENFSVQEFYEKDTPEGDALAMQPNLMDVLCGELEDRLRLLASAATHQAVADASSLGSALASPVGDDSPLLNGDQRALLVIASSMRKIGLQRADSLSALEGVMRRMAPLPLGALVFLLGELLGVQLRVVDVLDHVASDRVLEETKRNMALFLAHGIMAQPNLKRTLRRSPDAVIRLRRMFERSLILQENAMELWDVLRCVKVSHKQVAPKPKDGVERTSNLFKPKYSVKTQRVTSDLSEAERFVPPQFKTWRSPVHSPRGGHSQAKAKKQPRVIAFGTQRISKDYMKKKRRKYARHV